MTNNVVISNPGASLVKWGDGAATPYLTLSSVPSSGTVGVAVTGVVTNPSAATANWSVATSPSDTIVSPSSGTLSPGAAVAFTLTALAAGVKNVILSSDAPDVVLSGSPSLFFAASVAPPPSPAPAPTGAYRSTQTALFQPVDSALRAEQIVGGGNYNPDIWGPTNVYVDFQSGWAWANPGGDWIDSTLTAQGTTPWGSVPTPTGTAGVVYDQTMNITSAVQNVQANSRWCAFRLGRSAAARSIAGVFYSDSSKSPYIAVTYTDSTTANLACKVSAMIDSSSTAPQSTQAEITLPAFLEFDRPSKDVASAVLHFSVTQQQWSGSPTNIKLDGILNPPLNTDPATNSTGLAASSTALDASLSGVSGILGVHRYNDGSTLTDYYIDQSTKSKSSESNYDPAIWGGTQDLTKWPHTVANKWMRSNSGDPPPTLVSSSYTGEGFSPLYPGLGALRINMADQTVVPGQEVTTNGRLAADLLLMLPDSAFGTTDRIFVRYYRRIGTPYSPQPSDRVQVLSGGTPRWTDMSGKTGIGPSHATTFGGVSGTSGGGYGWQMRHSWYDADLGMGGPDEGGVTQGFHLYDYQSNNPVGYRYGTEAEQAERWGQRGGLGAVMYAGRWYEIETELKLNTINIGAGTYSADGELRCWIDGRLVYQRTGMVFRTAPLYAPAYNASQLRPARQLGVKELWLNIFHGGQSENTYPRTDFIAGLAWGTSRIGAMKSPAPSWVAGLTAVDSGGGWTALAMSQSSNAYLLSTYGSHSAWGGSSWAGMVDAYGDPAYDYDNQKLIFNCGGHGDLWANPVVSLNLSTLAWAQVAAPVDPTKMPPAYAVTAGQVNYPSGYSTGYFETAPPITDAADLPYASTVKSRPARHCYGAFNYYGGKALHSYAEPAIVDVSTGSWTIPSSKTIYSTELGGCTSVWVNNTELTGAAALARAANYVGGGLLQENTSGVIDPATGKLWLTLTAGSTGNSWRASIMRCNPTTYDVEAVYDWTPAPINGSTSIVIGGGYVWVFCPQGGLINQCWRINTTTNLVEYITLTGDTFAFSGTATQEVVPGFWNGSRVCLWNYSGASQLDAIYRINPTPVSGSGTSGSPYVMTITKTVMPSSGMPAPSYKYRIHYASAWGVAVVVPIGSSASLYALKV